MSLQTFTVTSDLSVSVKDFLSSLTMRNVNRELFPFVAMTTPTTKWLDRPITEWPVRQCLFHSWILLFGVIPIDRHSFYLEEIDPSRGFVEVSSTWVNKEWRHERSVVPTTNPEICQVIDKVTYRSRLSIVGKLLKTVYRLIFHWRHHRLRALFAK
jgi:ligand-binding SRPBCC domain-containing protein